MSKQIWAIVNGEKTFLRAQLAGAALQAAAHARGLNLDFSVAASTAAASFDRTPQSGDALIAIEQPEIPLIFAGLPRINATLDEVLARPAAILDRPASGGGEERQTIVAITSCPTGVAHTFMAAEGLEKAATTLGHRIRIETQGSVGAGTPLTADEIAAADLVIIAADREVDRGRFGGKKVFVSGTNPAITAGVDFIKRAFAGATTQAVGATTATAPTAKKAGAYKHLMNGVSFMLPFVVAGGLCIALAFAFGGINADGEFAQFLMKIGGSGGFALMVPVLSAYIAFSIADRPGLAPGMIGGILCNQLGTGFFGGIIAGFIAGYGVQLCKKLIRLPKNLEALMPVLVLPLLGTLSVCAVLYFVIGGPVAELNTYLSRYLQGMQGASSLVLGALLGGMMAIDMGGPVNKAAYAFSVGMLGQHLYLPIAAVMAAGMTPPLAAALATYLFKNRFTEDERKTGPATAVLGLAFISEGAIPFAARDPLRVIPAFIIGSALTGALTMVAGVQLMAPHGGVFVMLIPNAINNVGAYLLAIAAGTVVSAVLLGILKKKIAA
ncbi:PTS system fructose-specific EIIB'BC component [Planctomycetales bacterium]|nr:PTS system fructose-specific EIIB'BC component [Planctomycetales bacterium]